MITAVIGLPGSGKSLYLNKIILESLIAGERVLTNMVIDESFYKFTKRQLQKKGTLFHLRKISELQFFDRGIIVIDEIEEFFEARDWAKLSAEDRAKFRQHRHEKLDIFYSAEYFTRTDLVIRQLTQEVIEINNYFQKIFYVNRYNGFEYEKNEFSAEPINSHPKYFIRTKKLSRSYDTLHFEKKREPFKFELMSDYLSNFFTLK